MKKTVVILLAAVIAVSAAFGAGFDLGLRVGYGSVGYGYRDKAAHTKENSGYSGFPINIEFDYRFGDSQFGAMAVVGCAVGRSFFAETLANGETTNNLSANGKVMFDSFFSVYGKFRISEEFDLKIALGPSIEVFEANRFVKPGESVTAFILGLKLEGGLGYSLTDKITVGAGLGLNFGLADTAKSNASNAAVRDKAFTFGWDVFAGCVFGF